MGVSYLLTDFNKKTAIHTIPSKFYRENSLPTLSACLKLKDQYFVICLKHTLS